MDEQISEHLIKCIEEKNPVIFCKFGDGEYYCMSKYTKDISMERNCDNDNYTKNLSDSLISSFNYISKVNNAWIGRWHLWRNDGASDYFQNLSNHKVNWAPYHTFIFDNKDFESNEYFSKKIKIYNSIKKSKLKKIYICNKLLIKSKSLLDIDYLVHVPLNNWFDNEFDKIFLEIKTLIGDEKCIILTSCGMSSKVLIAELHKFNPQCLFFDLGSAIDLICTKRNSRGNIEYTTIYDKFSKYFDLPDDWNDSKYEPIYKEAYNNLGIHLPK